MSNIKERLFGAITVMSEQEAESLWNYIQSQHCYSWEDVEETPPDDVDLRMIQELEADPDCQIFASPDEVNKILGA